MALDEVVGARHAHATDRRRCSCAPATIATCRRSRPCTTSARRTRGFALRRDAPLIHYALAKKRLFAGLSARGSRQLEFFVAEEGASAVAYVVLSQNEHGWTLEEAGDRDPAGARLGAMLQVLLAREPSQRDPVIRAWWPRAFPVPPQLTLSNRSDPKDVFMVRPLCRRRRRAAGPGRRVLVEERLLLTRGGAQGVQAV